MFRIEVIDRKMAEILAAKTPAERVAIAFAAHETACTMIKCRIEQLYPDWSAKEKHNEFLRRLLGRAADELIKARG